MTDSPLVPGDPLGGPLVSRPRARSASLWTGGLAGAVGLMLALPVVGALVLDSPAGHRWLKDTVVGLVHDPAGLQLAIDDVEGSLFSSLTVTGLRLGDPQGLWLSASRVTVSWSPAALLQGHLVVRGLSADALTLTRLPDLPPDPVPPPSDEGGFNYWWLTRLRVESLALSGVGLGEALLGSAARLDITGDSRPGVGESAHLRLDVRRVDGVPGTLALEGVIGAAPTVMRLALTVDEPAGGLVARALALPGLPAVRLTLSGEGPQDAWHGDLSAEAEGVARINGPLALAVTEGGDARLSLDLGLAPLEAAPDLLSRIAGERGGLALTATWGADGHLGLSDTILSGAGWTLRAEGGFTPAEGAFSLVVDAATATPDLLAALLPGLPLAAAEARITGAGTLQRPTADAVVRLAGVAPAPEGGDSASSPASAPSVPLGFDRVDLRATLSPASPTPSAESSASGAEGDVSDDRLALGLVVETQGVRGLGAMGEAVVGASPRLSVAATWEPRASRLNVADARLDAAEATLSLRASVTSPPTSASASVSGPVGEGISLVAELPRLAVLSPGLQGGARLIIDAPTLALAPPSGTIHLRVEADAPGREGSPVAALLGPAPRLGARIRLPSPGESLEVEALRLEGAGLGGEGEGRWSPQEGLAARLALTVTDPAVLDPSLSGAPLTATLAASGPLDAPVLKIDGASERLSAAGIDLRALEATLDLRPVPSLEGVFSLRARAGSLPLTARVPFRQDGSAYTVAQGRIEAGRASADFDARVDPAALAMARGRVALSVPDLAALAPLGVSGIAGPLSGEVRLDPVAVAARDRNRKGAQPPGPSVLSLEARSAGLRSGADVLGRLDLKARVETPLTRPRLTAEASVQDGGVGSARWRRFALTAQGPLDQPSVSARLDGTLAPAGKDLPFNARLDLRPEKGGALRLQTLEAQAGPHRLALVAPAVIRLGGETVRFDDLALRLDGGTIQLGGTWGPRARLRLGLSAVPLAPANLFVPGLGLAGRLDGEARFEGSPRQPLLSVGLDVGQFRAGALEGRTLSGRFDARLDARRLAADLRVMGLSSTPLVASIGLKPGRGLRFGPTTALDGLVRWEGDLHDLWELTPLFEHRPAGPTTLDLTLAGTLGAPVVQGRVAVRQGRYENLMTGTVLKALDLDLNADATRQLGVRLSATDGGSGTVGLTGRFDLADVAHPRGQATLEATRATLVRRDDVTASLNAALALALTGDAARLTGTVTSDRVAVRLVGTLGATPPDLDVIEIGGRGQPTTRAAGLAERAAREAGPGAFPVALDLRVALPNRVYVSGQGIDTEWKGALHITGSADQPVIVGGIENLRGQVDLLGRTFSLRQSALRFDGGSRLDPQLDVRATNDTGDVTAVARITGSLSAPQVAFTSEPALPQDEVIAHILFGKSSGELSAIEAVQLARAAGELGGLGTGSGFIDTLRGITGLDVLKLGEGKDGATTVQAGTYLRENVYIGVVQGMGLGDSAVEVQVELTPSLSLETSAGASGAGKAGVLWKRDY